MSSSRPDSAQPDREARPKTATGPITVTVEGVNPKDKASWVYQAQLSGKKLGIWIIEKLNIAVRHADRNK